MSLPGFWATSSLYKSTKNYRAGAAPVRESAPLRAAGPLNRHTLQHGHEFRTGQPGGLFAAPLSSAPIYCSVQYCDEQVSKYFDQCRVRQDCSSMPAWWAVACSAAGKANEYLCNLINRVQSTQCRTDPSFRCELLAGGGVCINDECCREEDVCGAECCGSGTTCIKSADADLCCPTQLACGDQCCSPGSSCCGLPLGECVSLASDASNCGTCGNQCSPSQVCQNGSCECPGGKVCGAACCGDCQICDSGSCRNCDSSPPNCETCKGGNCVTLGEGYCWSSGTCCGECQMCDPASQTCQNASGCYGCQNGVIYPLPNGYPCARGGFCAGAGAGCLCGDSFILLAEINEGYTCCVDGSTGVSTVCTPDQPACCPGGKCAKTGAC